MSGISRLHPRFCPAGAVRRVRELVKTRLRGAQWFLPLALAGCDVLWQPYIEQFAVDCLANPAACSPDAACDPLQAACAQDDPDGGVMPASPPATCAQLQQQGNSVDMEYTLYVDGDRTKPYTVYCRDMTATPAEYLTLNPAPQANVARYNAANFIVSTEYQRVRLDPATLQVNCDDQTFASSKGFALYGTTGVTSVPFAVAVACVGTRIMGQIDLTGTPFAVPASAITISGGSPGGTQPSFAMNDQLVTLDAQGSCGDLTPAPVVNFPFNRSSGLRLQLKYRGN